MNSKFFNVVDWNEMSPHCEYFLQNVSLRYWGVLVDVDAHVLKNSGGRLEDKVIVVDEPNDEVVMLLQRVLDIPDYEIIARAPFIFSLPYEAYKNPYVEDEDEDEDEDENREELEELWSRIGS